MKASKKKERLAANTCREVALKLHSRFPGVPEVALAARLLARAALVLEQCPVEDARATI